MQQLTTVYQIYVTKNDQSVNPTFKNVEDCSPNRRRIDAPGYYFVHCLGYPYVVFYFLVLVVSTSAVECLERLVSEMTNYVPLGTLNGIYTQTSARKGSSFRMFTTKLSNKLGSQGMDDTVTISHDINNYQESS